MTTIIKPIIEIKKLGTRFGDEWIHKDLDLNIYPGKGVTIIGASGCGKTTLIREILMLQPITCGEIHLMGEKISNYLPEDLRTKQVLSKMGMMFQQCALFNSLTILENVMFPYFEYTKLSKETIEELAVLKLTSVGLTASSFLKYPSEISGGMLKRVALARTLALDPKVLFLDEPTAGLDPIGSAEFDELILKLKQALNLTVIMVTHDMDSIWTVSDEIIYLSGKKVAFHGPVEIAANAREIPELYAYFNGVRGQVTKEFYMKRKGL